ncbi:MAG: hypothetical protein QXS54_00775 [Candidatus Methanomethylicaceae archaeon]
MLSGLCLHIPLHLLSPAAQRRLITLYIEGGEEAILRWLETQLSNIPQEETVHDPAPSSESNTAQPAGEEDDDTQTLFQMLAEFDTY